MRGRKPVVLTIPSPDLSELERIAHSDSSPWYQVRRARIILGIASGQRREVLAEQLECDESTIWRTCQRYRELGFDGLLADQRQGHSGRDLVYSGPHCLDQKKAILRYCFVRPRGLDRWTNAVQSCLLLRRRGR